MSLITGVYVNTCSRKFSGKKALHVIGFYIETISGLQSDSRKGSVCKFILFSLPVLRDIPLFNVGGKINSTLQCVYKDNACCLSFMVTNIITTIFNNQKQITQSILVICQTRECTKRA